MQNLQVRSSSPRGTVNIKKDSNSGKDELQLPFDRGTLVLPTAPRVAEEDVPAHARLDCELGRLSRLDQQNLLQLILRDCLRQDDEQVDADHSEHEHEK